MTVKRLFRLLPPWINAIAMDGSGRWYGYSHAPVREAKRTDCKGSKQWIDGGHLCMIPPDYTPTYLGDWRDSLILRKDIA